MGRRTTHRVLALATAGRFAFNDLQLHRLHHDHTMESMFSCRVAAVPGLTLEGRLRQSPRSADGDCHEEGLHG